MPRPPSTDALFAAIHALRGSPLQAGDPQLHALMRQAQEEGQPWHLAYAQAVLAVRRLWASAHDEALQLAEASLVSFDALGCAWGRAAALSSLAVVRAKSGHVHQSLELHQASVAAARQAGDGFILASTLFNLAGSLRFLGQYETALVALEEGFSLRLDSEPRLRVFLCWSLALTLVQIARSARNAAAPTTQWAPQAQRAEQLLREQVGGDLPRVAELLPGEAQCWIALAAALVLQDRHVEAHRIFDLMLPHFASLDDHEWQQFLHLHLGWSHLQCGHWEEALACAQAHHGLVRDAGWGPAEHRGLEIEALALEQAGRWQEALAAHKRYHASHARYVLQLASEQARALAVAMQTDRALRESQVDPLTELANRRAFDTALAHAVGQPAGEAHALILVDMDHFKQVNDRHGHAAGDEALRALAAAMKRSCRSTDLPARLGGDEFAVLVAGGASAALQLAQRLRLEMSQWRSCVPGMDSPTLSLGAADLKPGMSAADWLAAADSALYAAKAAGRDGVHLYRPQEPCLPTVPPARTGRTPQATDGAARA